MHLDPPLADAFLPHLLATNPTRLSGFAVWVFHPGMLFGSREQWWGDPRPRPSPHEGLDLCWFQDTAGGLHRVPETLAVPAPLPGQLVRLAPDFLGTSIFFRHEIFSGPYQLYSALGHTRPMATLGVGDEVAAGDLIAHLAAARGRASRVPMHLHLTFAWLPLAASLECLDWRTLGRDPQVRLIDPLPLLSLPWRLHHSLPVIEESREQEA
jgi:hypothetical protein